MASPRPSSAARDNDGRDGGLPVAERLDRGTEPVQGRMSGDNLPLPAPTDSSSKSQTDPANPGKPAPDVAPIQDAEPGNETTAPLGPQEPQSPLDPDAPGAPTGWWKRSGGVKSIKVMSPRPRPLASTAPISQKPEATDEGSSKPADAQGKAGETDKTGPAKPEANLPPHASLIELSNLPLSVVPSVDIIAVHDIGQSLPTAWAYTPESPPAKRPGAQSKDPKQPQTPTSSTPRASHAGQPFPPPSAATFKAGLKALGEPMRGMNHIESWKDKPDEPEPPAAADKGKDRGDNDGDASPHEMDVLEQEHGERGGLEFAQKRAQQTPAGENREKKPEDYDQPSGGRSNRPSSNRPSSNRGSKPPSVRDKGLKAGNWLTDRTMLAGDLDRSRVHAFAYKPLESTQPTENSSKKPDYEKYLQETAEALHSKLREVRKGRLSQLPLVFIATGFGCLIIQKWLAHVDRNPRWSRFMNKIAGIIFFDAPSIILKENGENLKTERESLLVPVLPPPVSSGRTARVKAILESRKIDSWSLWLEFSSLTIKCLFTTVWFHTTPSVVNRTGIQPRATGIDFVKLDALQIKATTNRLPSRFRGPKDPSYRALVDQINRCLLLAASTNKGLEELLTQFIDRGYNLGVKDHRQRSPLHRAARAANDAALIRLVSAKPQLVVGRDGEGLTPLHSLVIAAVEARPSEEERVPFRMMIEKLLSALAEHCGQQVTDDLRDKWGKSPWAYARERDCKWILELKEHGSLFSGARAARFETLDDPVKPLTKSQSDACKSSEATLAQFYIAKDSSVDYLDLQRPGVYSVIYDHDDGVERLFHRNLRPDEDKRATCRWIHLPANNERWMHDLFIQQLRRIDKSTSVRRHQGPAPFDRYIAHGAYRYKQICEAQTRETPSPSPNYPFPSPSFSVHSADETGTRKKNATALFMPIFGFEKHANRKELSCMMRDDSYDRCVGETPGLIKAYFFEKETQYPFHCRRTLDQFTYHMLEDTEKRDNTQVIFKWTTREKSANRCARPNPTTRESYPLLMVDQLWLWVLDDEQTVITSVPNTWEPAKEYNFVRHLIQHELMENDDRPLIEGPMDLANIIIRCSVDFLHRKGPHEVTLYECFQSSITVIAEQQAKQFDKFKDLVRRLNDDSIDPSTRATWTNQLFQLTAETDLLAEIMDILDELKTIHDVLLRQRDAVKSFARLLSNNRHKDRSYDESDSATDTPGSWLHGPAFFEDMGPMDSPDLDRERKPLQSALYRDGGRPRIRRTVQFADERFPYQRSKSWNLAMENVHQVESNIATIKEMTAYAEKVRMEINGLLSHRQKQANAWEARFAREGSDHTQRQSNITLVFTVVTVFFLPLSFMASVFAIQIDAFPHHEQTGELNWPWREAFGLLFGVSFGMILLVAFLGFYINRIWRFLGGYLVPTKVPTGYGSAQDPTDWEFARSHITSETTVTRSRRGDRLSNFSAQTQDKYAEDMIDRDQDFPEIDGYAPLFGRWNFHFKLPGIRKLWKYRSYYTGMMHVFEPEPPASEVDSTGQARSGRATSAGATEWVHETEFDYPLNRAWQMINLSFQTRIVFPMAKFLLPASLRKKLKLEHASEEDMEEYYQEGDGQDGYHDDGYPNDDYPHWRVPQVVYIDPNGAYPEDGYPNDGYPNDGYPDDGYSDDDYSDDGCSDNRYPDDQDDGHLEVAENSIRSSMQRSTATGGADSWHLPAGSLRRRTTQPPPPPPERQGKASIVARFLPWRWRGKDQRDVAAATSDNSGVSVATSVDAVLDHASALGSDEDETGRTPERGGLGGVRRRTLKVLPSFRRKFAEAEIDLESGARARQRSRRLAGEPQSLMYDEGTAGTSWGGGERPYEFVRPRPRRVWREGSSGYRSERNPLPYLV